MQIFVHFYANKFAQFKKKLYICTKFKSKIYGRKTNIDERRF